MCYRILHRKWTILYQSQKFSAYIDLDFVVEVELIVEDIIGVVFTAVRAGLSQEQVSTTLLYQKQR